MFQTSAAPLHTPAGRASPLLNVTLWMPSDPSTALGLIPGGYFTFVGRNNMNDPKDTFVLPWFGAVANSSEQAVGKARIDPRHSDPVLLSVLTE